MIGQIKRIKMSSTTKRKLSTEISEKDLKTLQFQLSHVRKYNEPEKVLARCKWGYPTVTFVLDTRGKKQKKELEEEMISGTLLWMTCPRYKEIISKLEEAKFTQELQKKIDNDEGKQIFI
jgi:hypothetical protein